MFKMIAPLMTDFYKSIHHLAYVPGMDYLTSYWTLRKSRIENVDHGVLFGVQYMVKSLLIDTFNEHFFSRPWEEIHEEYVRVIKHTMNEQAANDQFLKELYDLGYLPIEVKALPEGTLVPMGCPCVQFRNTVPGFGWVVNFLETPISATMWAPITTATIGHKYRGIVHKYFTEAGVTAPERVAAGDFSMRGMTSPESAYAASAGHLLSFLGTATIGAIPWMEYYYNCDCTKEPVGTGTPSTEHSVMESYGKDGEFECYRHLIQDVFPKGPLSIVSDTYDYWKVLTEYLPKLKDVIIKRDGKIIIRGDSGDPVDIVCGELQANSYLTVDGLTEDGIKDWAKEYAEENYPWDGSDRTILTVRIGDYLYKVLCDHAYEDGKDGEDNNHWEHYTATVEYVEVEKTLITPAQKGTVEILWDIFGGTVNEKGYKTLESHIGAIYGDGITPERATAIYERLMAKGFAPNNCTLGIGSYAYQYVTRDSLGQALKATHCVVDGEDRIIFKDPVTDKVKGNFFKKSQKGMCYVYKTTDGKIAYKEELNPGDLENPEYADNMLQPVFKDGKLLSHTTLKEIRDRLNNGQF